MTEKILHTQVCQYLDLQYPDVIYTSDMSGMRVSIGLRVEMKRKQCKKYVIPDLLILHPKKGYHGLLIEIKADKEDLYNYKDILNMVKKAMKKYKFDGGLIDPYNGLKIEITPTSKLNTHEYHYEAISEIKQFGSKYDISWFINNHAVTSALRTKGTDGFQKAPNKEDTEGGGKFSNKAAQFATIHRNTQHPTEWMVTDIHIRKVKEIETGGKVTPRDTPIRIVMKKSGCAFAELAGFDYDDKPLYGIDPIAEFHKKNIPTQISFEENLKQTEGYRNEFLDNLTEDELPF